ncbi:MAG: hypothetical protein K0R15_757 [Clostridiales bacterium]|nr:hypothetical protein [Clostridiales bacterium]
MKVNIIIHKRIKPLFLILVALLLMLFCIILFHKSKLYEYKITQGEASILAYKGKDYQMNLLRLVQVHFSVVIN